MNIIRPSLVLHRSAILLSFVSLLNLNGDQTALSQAENIIDLGTAISMEVEHQSKRRKVKRTCLVKMTYSNGQVRVLSVYLKRRTKELRKIEEKQE